VATRVTDPFSPMFRQYLTRQEMRDLSAAPAHVSEAVIGWIHSESLQEAPLHIRDSGDILKVTMISIFHSSCGCIVVVVLLSASLEANQDYVCFCFFSHQMLAMFDR